MSTPHRVRAEAVMAHTARGTAGSLAVHRLEPTAAEALCSVLGEEFSVPVGGFRTYLPQLDPARPDEARRHRATEAQRYLHAVPIGQWIIRQALGPVTTTRRAPSSYSAAQALLAASLDDEADVWQELAESTEKGAADLREDLMDVQRRYVSLVEDNQALREELAAVREQLRVVARASARLAQEHLHDRLSIPAQALVGRTCWTPPPGARVGVAAWQAFQALATYAEEAAHAPVRGATGNFWTWCQQSGHPLVWRATSIIAAVAWRSGAALLSFDADHSRVADVIGVSLNEASLRP